VWAGLILLKQIEVDRASIKNISQQYGQYQTYCLETMSVSNILPRNNVSIKHTA